MRLPETENSRHSPLGRVSPRVKLLASLVLICFTALLPRQPHLLYLVPSAILLVLWPLSGMPLSYALRRLLIVEFFILGMAMLLLITPDALPVFLSALLKSNLCVVTMLI